MRGVNKVILLGAVIRDPEVRSIGASGSTVTTVSIATSDAYKDKTGILVEQTEFHRVVFYGRLAEISGEYLRKQSKVYVEGSLHHRKWQDKTTGQDRYITEIKASVLQLLDTRASANNQSSAGEPDYGNYGGGQQEDYQSAPRAANKPANNRPAPVAHNDLDDDLPF